MASSMASSGVSIHASVMEATCRDGFLVHNRIVSIHASVMEATRGPPTGLSNFDVSIHASVMEATGTFQTCAREAHCFDPRLRDGGDDFRDGTRKLTLVSIHASVMEATLTEGEMPRLGNVSIHASVMEATLRIYRDGYVSAFRSTPP